MVIEVLYVHLLQASLQAAIILNLTGTIPTYSLFCSALRSYVGIHN